MKRAILGLSVAFMLCVSPVYADNVLKISGLPNYPPVLWKAKGTLLGVGAELAKTICTELRVSFKFKPLPWVRALSEAEQGKIDMIAGVYIKKDRQEYMDYSVPFMKDPSVIFVLKGHAFPFKRLKDLIGKKGVNMLGYSWGETFDRFSEEHLDITTVSKPLQALMMLERGRVDYFVYGLYSGEFVAAKSDMADKVEPLTHHVSEEGLYITFSKKSKFRHLLPRANDIIERLKSEGVIDRWVEQYLEKYRETLTNKD
ncbi:MAG: transporter substrate-binding domain-containing protein [Deltaproteobacteria bacterium]|nr:transporter substrate-binding domain-containing protein [Deltaproteobacteria bacterium]